MPVSKTDFIRGLQCEKMLWLDAHRPELKIIPPEVQAKLDAGNDFGDQAMGIFGPFTETTTLKADGRLDFSAMIEKTKTLLENGENVICEGSFSWYGNFCAADILKKETDGYALYEVKNSALPRREFIIDLGFQRLILKKCGVKITSSNLILPELENSEDGGQVCVERLQKDGIRYKIFDVTTQAKRFEYMAQDRIFELGKLKKKDTEEPRVSVGEQCDSPYRCWYYEFCHGENCQKINAEDE